MAQLRERLLALVDEQPCPRDDHEQLALVYESELLRTCELLAEFERLVEGPAVPEASS